MSRKLGIEEALDVAMEAELKSQAFYAQAAVDVQDAGGRDLLARLAAFEQYHYQKLTELAHSLREGGRYIVYESRTLEQFAPLDLRGEATAVLLEQLQDVPGILSTAIDREKVAGEQYRLLAEETADADGRGMFRKLADEEMTHQRILEDEFFSLSNRGVWGWSGMYGE